MKLTWYGHSCFMLESRAGKVVFDPYADDFPPGLRLPQLAADLVLCSHGHGDHNAEDKVTLSGEQTDYTVESLCCWHDDEGGKKRGEEPHPHRLGRRREGLPPGRRGAHALEGADKGHRARGRPAHPRVRLLHDRRRDGPGSWPTP